MTSYLPGVISTIRTDAFDRQVDRLFNEALQVFDSDGQRWVPASNVWEDENRFYVQLALPGWEPKNIAIEVDNQILTVKGEHHTEFQDSVKFHRREIADGLFTQRFRLPSFVEQDKASATHKHGLLTVTFPKREEAKCRRIMIDES